MAEQFNNEQVVKLFGKQIEKIGERKAEAVKNAVAQKTSLKKHMEQFREQNKQAQQKLDQAIESFEDRFTDTANVLEYDTARLEKKYLNGKTLQSSKKTVPCFDERVGVATCYITNKDDTMVCDAFIKALTECANKAVTAN